jgi:PPOX class probable F420-dependent enzyme
MARRNEPRRIAVDLDHAREFIRLNHHAILHTFRGDGSPQMSPVACGVDAAGFVVVSTRETAMKTKNLKRDARASRCVISDGFFGEWVQVDGTATVVSLPDALDGLVDYYRMVAGEHPDWDDYRNAMQREQRVLVRVELQRAGPTRSG